MLLFQTRAERALNLTRIEELHEYLTREPARPKRLTAEAYAQLSPAEQARHDLERVRYISGGMLVATPDVQRALRSLKQCFGLNVGSDSGHVGVLLSGESAAGKTTTVKALMRQVHTEYFKQYPDAREHGCYPVAFLEVPEAASCKAFARAFADTLGLSYSSGEAHQEIMKRVAAKLEACDVQLVCIDELHNLTGRGQPRGDVVDMLKGLSNRVAATFVYSGIDIARSAFFEGARGDQIRGRFTAVEIRCFNHASADDRAVWHDIVAGIETLLPLRNLTPGTLPALADYLHERSGGSLGSLTRLIAAAALTAIETKTERIDREALDIVRLDIKAEERHRQALSRPRPSRGAHA